MSTIDIVKVRKTVSEHLTFYGDFEIKSLTKRKKESMRMTYVKLVNITLTFQRVHLVPLIIILPFVCRSFLVCAVSVFNLRMMIVWTDG